MNQVSSRTDDMIVVKGVSLFPVQIENILKKAQDKEPHFRLIIDNEDGIDSLEVQVEISDSLFADEVKKLVELKGNITNDIFSELGVSAQVTLVEPETIRQGEVDYKKVVDNR